MRASAREPCPHRFCLSAIKLLQRSAKVLVHGCEKFDPALAYLFCLALPGSCLARFAYFLADLCMTSLAFGLESSMHCPNFRILP